MKTCIECGWNGDERELDRHGHCPECEAEVVQDEIELHLQMDGWECFVTINKPARFARAVSQNTSDFITGAPIAKRLASMISSAFGVSVRIVSGNNETDIDEF